MQEQLNAAPHTRLQPSQPGVYVHRHTSYDSNEHGTVSACDVHDISMLALGGNMCAGMDKLLERSAAKTSR